MNSEYLLFNLVILAGPLGLSFRRPLYYRQYWQQVFLAISPPLVLFVLWDVLVTGRHWWFNEQFTFSFRLAGLPVGEWLFFITVPFSCLLIWVSLRHYRGDKPLQNFHTIYRWLLLAIPLGIIFFWFGKEYTGLVFLAIGLLPLLEKGLGTSVLLNRNTYLFLGLVILLILVFNGYLTARPLVLYNEQYQLGIRVLSIPIEDFGYGMAHLLSCVMIFDRLTGKTHEA